MAVERYYYKLQPVTDEDVALVRLLLLERVPYYVKERCELLIHNLTVPLLMKEAIDPANPNLKEISERARRNVIATVMRRRSPSTQYMRTKKLRARIEALPLPPVSSADMKQLSSLV